MNLQAVFFDLDGTIVDKQYCLAQAAPAAFQQLHEKGIKLCIATGRSYVSAKEFIDQLQFVDGAVFSNGAVVQHPDTKELIVRQTISPENTLYLSQLLMKNGFSFKFQSLDGAFFQYGPKIWPHYDSDIFSEAEYKGSLTTQSIKFILLCPTEGEGSYQNLQQLFEQHSQLSQNLRYFRSSEALVEIAPLQVSKWAGVQYFLDIWQISPDQVVTVGDQENDYEMIKYAGFGVAVRDGFVGNLQVAKMQIPPPEEGGVSVLLQYLLQTV